jgi:hypothetical protein
MNIRLTFQDRTSGVKNKSLILGMVEASNMPYNRSALRDSEFGSNLSSIEELLKRVQLQTVIESLKALIRQPVFAKQLRGSKFRRCQSVRRVAIDPRFHHLAVKETSERPGLSVVGIVAVGNSNGNTFIFGPTEESARKEQHVAMHNVVVSFSKNSSKTTTKVP